MPRISPQSISASPGAAVRTAGFALLLSSVFAILTPDAGADEATDRRIEGLTQKIEEQSREIEILSSRVERLTKLMERAFDQVEGRAPSQNATDPSGNPATSSSPSASATVPPEPDVSNAPKAEAVQTPVGRTHAVVKGETLTSIAKSYGVAVGELKTLNHITDERKLQIGQVLKVPGTAEEQPPAEASPAVQE